MKKTILSYGLIGGIISSLGFIFMSAGDDFDMTNGMIYGFTAMIIAFSLIFVAIKNYRDKTMGGTITFGKALTMGLLIALVASTVYVIAWLITYYNFHPDFMEKYTQWQIEQMRQDGATAEAIATQIEANKEAVESYKNPLVVIAYTYTEILWLGIIFSFIAAAVLKKKPQHNKEELNTWLDSEGKTD